MERRLCQKVVESSQSPPRIESDIAGPNAKSERAWRRASTWGSVMISLRTGSTARLADLGEHDNRVPSSERCRHCAAAARADGRRCFFFSPCKGAAIGGLLGTLG